MKMVIDSAGRVVIPKPLRERLGLSPGTELDARVEDGELVVCPRTPEVVLVRNDKGRLVLRTTAPVPPMTVEDVGALIDEIYQERERHILNLGFAAENGDDTPHR